MSPELVRRERARVERWASRLDPTRRGEIDWLRVLVALGLVLASLVAVVGWAPVLRDFFRLRPAVPVATLLLAMAAMLLSIRWPRGELAPVRLAGASLAAAFLFQLFASSLVIQCEPPGAFALAVLPVLMAGFAGLILRAGPAFAWVSVAEALGMATALALRPDAPHLGLFLVLGPAAVGSCLFLGSQVERLDRERDRAERQRSAIQAQVLEERAADARRLAATLAEIGARSREASEAIAASARAGEELARTGPAGPSQEGEALAASLRGSLERVKQALDATRHLGQARELRRESLDAAPVASVARAVTDAIRSRFPRVAVGVRCTSPGAEHATAVVRGGSESLQVALEQLVTNACEGRGMGGARWVEIAIEDQPHLDALALRISDDGPGFPAELLARPIAPFTTSKPNGTGLGLYTSERLVRASGGSLCRENLPGGGAVVTLYLERAGSGERAPRPRASAVHPGAILDRLAEAARIGDAAALRAVLAPDFRLRENGVTVLSGVEAALARIERIRKAVPDLSVESEGRLVRGPQLVVGWTCTFTHREEILGIAGGGGPVRLSGVAWVTLRDGRIGELSVWWDNLALLRQLGSS